MLNKIQISPKKMVEEATIIWPSMTEDTEIVIDPREEGFIIKPESLRAIYCFGILGITPPEKIPSMIKNFYNILKNDGEIYIVEHDFDYIARAYLGGDLQINEFNKDFRRTTYLNRDQVVELLSAAGFPKSKQAIWLDPKIIPFQHFEFALSAKKIKE